FNYLPVQGTLQFNPNGKLPFSRYAGEPDFDRLDRKQAWIGYEFERHLNDRVTVRQNLRYARTSFDGRAITILNTGGLAADMRTLRRTAANTQADNESFALDNQAQFQFNSGPLRHDMLMGLDFRKENDSFNFGRGPAPSIDIYAPVYGAPVNDPGFNLSNT